MRLVQKSNEIKWKGTEGLTIKFGWREEICRGWTKNIFRELNRPLWWPLKFWFSFETLFVCWEIHTFLLHNFACALCSKSPFLRMPLGKHSSHRGFDKHFPCDFQFECQDYFYNFETLYGRPLLIHRHDLRHSHNGWFVGVRCFWQTSETFERYFFICCRKLIISCALSTWKFQVRLP